VPGLMWWMVLWCVFAESLTAVTNAPRAAGEGNGLLLTMLDAEAAVAMTLSRRSTREACGAGDGEAVATAIVVSFGWGEGRIVTVTMVDCCDISL
jgi:hypothetical protein